MDSARLQAILDRGYGIAAKKIGMSYAVYRPSSAHNPLDPDNQIATLKASFTPHNAGSFSYEKSPDHQGALFHGLYDGSSVQNFDYLTDGAGHTYFVAGKDPIFPSLSVECNRIITVTRPAGSTQLGINSYGGSVPETELEIMTAWPGSILAGGGRGSSGGRGDLPGDVGSGKWSVMLPYFAGVLLRASDILVDDLGNRFITEGCELQSYGWRFKAMQMVT